MNLGAGRELLASLYGLQTDNPKARIVVMNEDDAKDLVRYIIDDIPQGFTQPSFELHKKDNYIVGLNLRTTTAFPRGFISLRTSHASLNPIYHVEGAPKL